MAVIPYSPHTPTRLDRSCDNITEKTNSQMTELINVQEDKVV